MIAHTSDISVYSHFVLLISFLDIGDCIKPYLLHESRPALTTIPIQCIAEISCLHRPLKADVLCSTGTITQTVLNLFPFALYFSFS